jgi:hypothetical protein
MLHIYLNDHLAAETGAVELARRTASALRDSDIGPALDQLARDIAVDREALLTAMSSLRIGVTRYKVGVAWVGEKVGRLKLNGSWVSRSPLSTVYELEALILLAHSRRMVWASLLALGDERLTSARLEELAARADDQIERLESMRADAAAEVLTSRTADPVV